MEMKTCRVCKVVNPECGFSNSELSLNSPQCRECKADYHKRKISDLKTKPDKYKNFCQKRRDSSRVSKSKTGHQKYNLSFSFGMTVEEYNSKLAAQNGACAICKKPERMVMRGKLLKLAVDHSHATGRNRSLLCSACNRFVGVLEKDADLLAAAISYLRSHEEQEAKEAEEIAKEIFGDEV